MINEGFWDFLTSFFKSIFGDGVTKETQEHVTAGMDWMVNEYGKSMAPDIKKIFKQKNSKSFQSFFRSFKINDYNLLHYEKWIGKYGAIRVKHEKDDEYDVCFETRVIYCLYGKQQDVLPAWHDGPILKSLQEPF
jgi:hypothetical protein